MATLPHPNEMLGVVLEPWQIIRSISLHWDYSLVSRSYVQFRLNVTSLLISNVALALFFWIQIKHLSPRIKLFFHTYHSGVKRGLGGQDSRFCPDKIDSDTGIYCFFFRENSPLASGLSTHIQESLKELSGDLLTSVVIICVANLRYLHPFGRLG